MSPALLFLFLLGQRVRIINLLLVQLLLRYPIFHLLLGAVRKGRLDLVLLSVKSGLFIL